jgi:hypothetical protein
VSIKSTELFSDITSRGGTALIGLGLIFAGYVASTTSVAPRSVAGALKEQAISRVSSRTLVYRQWLTLVFACWHGKQATNTAERRFVTPSSPAFSVCSSVWLAGNSRRKRDVIVRWTRVLECGKQSCWSCLGRARVPRRFSCERNSCRLLAVRLESSPWTAFKLLGRAANRWVLVKQRLWAKPPPPAFIHVRTR